MTEKTVKELLVELLVEEVLPSIQKFNEGQRVIVWSHADDAVMNTSHLLSTGPLSGEMIWSRSVIWDFADKASIVEPRMIAERAVSNLGVSKHAFWTMVLHYALWNGLRDYRKLHNGADPVDWSAYLYAMLTCDDLSEEIRKDF